MKGPHPPGGVDLPAQGQARPERHVAPPDDEGVEDIHQDAPLDRRGGEVRIEGARLDRDEDGDRPLPVPAARGEGEKGCRESEAGERPRYMSHDAVLHTGSA